MLLEQNSETMNLEQNNSNVYLSFQRAPIVCKRIPGLTDVTQPNCDFVLWYIQVGSCHCPVLIRTHIDTNLFLCLCVYTVCVIFACLIQPLEPIFVCVLVIVRVFFRWETPTLWILFDWQPATSIVEICTPVASDEGVMMKHRKEILLQAKLFNVEGWKLRLQALGFQFGKCSSYNLALSCIIIITMHKHYQSYAQSGTSCWLPKCPQQGHWSFHIWEKSLQTTLGLGFRNKIDL